MYNKSVRNIWAERRGTTFHKNNQDRPGEEEEIKGEMLEILKEITFADGGVEVEHLADKFKISKPKALFYLDVLGQRGFVKRTAMAMAGEFYYPTAEGRKYLFDRDLL